MRRYHRRRVNHFDRIPAPSGYTVTIDTIGGPAAGTINRIHVWPAEEDPRVAMVILTTNGKPVSTWYAWYIAATNDAIELWIYYQNFRDSKSGNPPIRRRIRRRKLGGDA